MLLVLLAVAVLCTSAEMVQNWQASVEPSADPNGYRVVFEWDHNREEAIVVGKIDGSTADHPSCSGGAQDVAADGQPYWMPRFFPRKVSDEIKALTGIQFASVDWQPCGHKEISICHGESHYDFHLYYVPESDLSSWSMCDIGTHTNPRLPVCENSGNPINKAYYHLIDENMPVAANITDAWDPASKISKTFDFCVDPSSAILRSGIHYGDRRETLDEWATPVTIIGSHDCQLKFFEPMISWAWIEKTVKRRDITAPWPFFEVSDIQYNKKGFEALPHGWSINVSEGCMKPMGNREPGHCHIRLVIEGTRCPAGGCMLERKCGKIKNCQTNQDYVDRFPIPTTTTTTPNTTTTSSTTFTSDAQAPTSNAQSLLRLGILIAAWAPLAYS